MVIASVLEIYDTRAISATCLAFLQDISADINAFFISCRQTG